jgi:hypothetical protein
VSLLRQQQQRSSGAFALPTGALSRVPGRETRKRMTKKKKFTSRFLGGRRKEGKKE